jgi:plastocyanin
LGRLAAVALAIAGAGCGKSDPAETGPAISPRTVSPSAQKSQPATATAPKRESATATPDAPPAGNLTGTISMTGASPEPALLVKQGDSTVKDAQVCGLHDIPDESLIVNREANNGIAGVFVYLVKSPLKSTEPPPSEPAILDQIGCRYAPHTAVVRVGQPVHFLSNDAVAHNVHTLPTRNAPFNQTVPASSRDGIKLVYSAFELEPIEIKCDIHPWMRAYQLVVNHPFAAVTDEKGRFEINNLPAGAHSFRIWHERGRLLEREYKVEIPPGETKDVTIAFDAAKFSRSGR